MSEGRDPLGRRALFGAPPADAGGDAALGSGAEQGRRAFFSAAEPLSEDASATVTVTCRSCRATTSLEPGAAVGRLVGTLWWPLGAWNHRMRCPACDQTSWCRVSWDGLIDWR